MVLIFTDLLDFWNKHHHENENDNERHPFPSTYSQVKRKDVDQGLFIATERHPHKCTQGLTYNSVDVIYTRALK
jgi:hypothetical protein